MLKTRALCIILTNLFLTKLHATGINFGFERSPIDGLDRSRRRHSLRHPAHKKDGYQIPESTEVTPCCTTTWVYSPGITVLRYPGYHELTRPRAARYEQEFENSNNVLFEDGRHSELRAAHPLKNQVVGCGNPPPRKY